MKTFKQKVQEVVAQIPKRKTMSYGEVAQKAGSKKASRAVGTIMSQNMDTKKIPCHRVVKSNGNIGEYAFGGTKKKIKILEKEGVKMKNDKIEK